MSIFHIHKFKKPKDKWAVDHVITTKNTNPYHEGLKDNCNSFIEKNSGQLIMFDFFFKSLARNQPQSVIDVVKAIQAIANKNYQRELLFEKVRAEQFPELPSRLKCLYAFDSLERMSDWVKDVVDNSRCHPSERMNYEIVELSPSGNTKLFETQDAAVYGCEKLTETDIADRAKSYWGAKCGGKKEILLEGMFRVINVIDM